LAIRPHLRRVGLTDRDFRDGEVYTWYVGGRQSPRNVRIYRKDLEDLTYAALYGPAMRWELILKDRQAVAWWQAWSEDRSRGLASGARQIQDMTGFRVRDELEEVPQLEVPEAAGLAESVVGMLSQYGVLMAALHRAGADLAALAEQSIRVGNRKRRWRVEKKLKNLNEAGLECVLGLVSALLPTAPEASEATDG
jgi:hypothetical protein